MRNKEKYIFKEYRIEHDRLFHMRCNSQCRWNYYNTEHMSYRCHKCQEKIPNDVRAFWVLTFEPYTHDPFEVES